MGSEKWFKFHFKFNEPKICYGVHVQGETVIAKDPDNAWNILMKHYHADKTDTKLIKMEEVKLFQPSEKFANTNEKLNF